MPKRARRPQSYRLPKKFQAERVNRRPSASRAGPSKATTVGIEAEQLARVIGGLTIAFYVVGLLATNGYLFSLGVSDFSVLRPRFVYTGALITISGILAYALPALVFLQSWQMYRMHRTLAAEQQDTDNDTKHAFSRLDFISLLGSSCWSLLVVPVLLFVLFDAGDNSNDWLHLAPAAIGVSLAGLAAGSFIHYIWHHSNGTISSARRIRRVFEEDEARAVPRFGRLTSVFSYRVVYGTALAVLAVIALSAFALYTSIFMRFAYPRIPAQFGGGKPETVQLIFETEKAPLIRQLGVPVPAKGTISEPVRLLYQGNEVYVLRLTDQKVVQIDKRLAPGLIVDHEKS